MDDEMAAGLLQKLRESVLPQREEALAIIARAREMMQHEENVVRVSGAVNVFGDIHGQFYDLLHMLDATDTRRGMLFLGDYVDRGYNSIEVILCVLLLKIRNGKKVFLLRGNHENRAQTAVYGFRTECVAKYDLYVYWKICELFEYFPLAAVVNDYYFCIHGGICPGLSLDRLNGADRVHEFPELGNVLWSDPTDDTEYFVKSQRGAGYLFGRTAAVEFLKRIGCQCIVRSHQLVFDGVKEHLDGACITLWSAPNYCYKCKNLAAVMLIDGQHREYIFFDAVEEQYKNVDCLTSCP